MSMSDSEDLLKTGDRLEGGIAPSIRFLSSHRLGTLGSLAWQLLVCKSQGK